MRFSRKTQIFALIGAFLSTLILACAGFAQRETLLTPMPLRRHPIGPGEACKPERDLAVAEVWSTVGSA